MSKRWLILMLVTLLILVLSACGGEVSESTATPSVDEGETQGELAPEEEESEGPAAQEIDAALIFAANCARCHGEDRSGGRGPALLPERLTNDAAVYQATIRDGSGGMPSFNNRFSADEIGALVDFILSDPQ